MESTKSRDLICLAIVLLVAMALRLIDLDVRPLHADEANQAVKTGHLLEGKGYRFDPADHHGPTLYYFGALAARLRGEPSLASLTETTLRIVPVIAGVIAVALVWMLARPLGLRAACVAAFFCAISPAAVYYSRYFIQESLLVAFALGAFVCGQRAWRTGSPGWSGGCGLMTGFMLGTKASALVHIAAAVIALVVSLDWKSLRARAAVLWRNVAIAAASAAVVVALFYTSFGSNFAGLADFFSGLATMLFKATAGETGHEKPWWYYGSLFVFQRTGGYYWDQTLFLVLAAAGAALAWRGLGLARFVLVHTAIVAVVFSAAPYKTPWQIINVVPGLCILAAWSIARVRAAAAVPFAAAVSMLLAWQTWQAVFFRPSDARNPYAYVHSSPDIKRAEVIARAAPEGVIKVIADEYWPLPWYLRHRAEVGYWSEPPADCDGVIVFVDAAQADQVRARLNGDYRSGLIGLRPGVILEVFVRQ